MFSMFLDFQGDVKFTSGHQNPFCCRGGISPPYKKMHNGWLKFACKVFSVMLKSNHTNRT
jgi:hypothetical protein